MKGVKGLEANFHVYRECQDGFFHAPRRTSLYAKAESFVRLGEHPHVPRRTDKLIKASWTKDQEHFQKALQRFENALSSFWGIIFAKNQHHLNYFNKPSFRLPPFQKQQREIETKKGNTGKTLFRKPYPFGQTSVLQR